MNYSPLYSIDPIWTGRIFNIKPTPVDANMPSDSAEMGSWIGSGGPITSADPGRAPLVDPAGRMTFSLVQIYRGGEREREIEREGYLLERERERECVCRCV